MRTDKEVQRLAIIKFRRNTDCRSRAMGIPIDAEKYADEIVEMLNKYSGHFREDMERLLLEL